MDGKISYLNTDLDLVSSEDLTALAAAFAARGMYSLHVTHSQDGFWYATFESDEQHADPEASISTMVSAIESLESPEQLTWLACMKREFNIGYDCGNEPWAFNQRLSPQLLRRVASAGASLRITIYPDRE